MSINALANAAVARRQDIHPLGVAPEGYAQIAAATDNLPGAGAPPPKDPIPGAGAGAPPPKDPIPGAAEALKIIFAYIPTEIVTVYLAAVAAINSQQGSGNALWYAFFAGLVATPVTVWLVYAAKLKGLGKPLPKPWKEWPVWEMVTASIGFFVWAFALPDTPFACFEWYNAGLAGLALVMASTILGLLAPFFQRPLA